MVMIIIGITNTIMVVSMIMIMIMMLMMMMLTTARQIRSPEAPPATPPPGYVGRRPTQIMG